jgi:hypothetical protein
VTDESLRLGLENGKIALRGRDTFRIDLEKI